MRLCARCGLQMPEAGDTPLCDYHGAEYGPDWAEGNRIMCAFFHRGAVPERVADEPEPVEYTDF